MPPIAAPHVSSIGLGLSLRLAVPALILSVLISLILGVIAAIRQNGWIDHAITVFTLSTVSGAVFCVGIFAHSILCILFAWFPFLQFPCGRKGAFYWMKS